MRHPASVRALSDLLALVGYDASPETIETWPLLRRVEAEVHATNLHLRASDNALHRHPRPSWMPEPWQGETESLSTHPFDGMTRDQLLDPSVGSVWESPGGTVLP